jgi:formylglycine-generating enzyme required for sulfatase activity
MPLIPGEILSKRYRIVTLLGEGHYGAVYRAWDATDHLDVAIKEYLETSVEIQRLFRAEVARLSKLKHPQIPEVLDHFYLEGTGLYLVSNYIEGEGLGDLVTKYGRLPSDLIIGWLQSACEPISYLHEVEQLHLNIKPVNIRITPQGNVILVDTGLPGLGVGVGTSGYAAPEQQAQGLVTVASDIYGLGATLYTLLTCKVPPDSLRRESGLDLLIPARDVNPDVEPYLSVVASRAMDLRPDVRFESVMEFAQALERPIGRPDHQVDHPRRTEPASPTAPPPEIPKSARRQIEQRTIIGLTAILVLFIGVVIGLGLAGRSPEVQDAQLAATETLESIVVAALTQITTLTPTTRPTATPIATPAPFIHEITAARMIFVPASSFRMGNDEAEFDEAPFHRVRLDAYFIDEFEVTNGQYALCVEAGECNPPSQPGATLHQSYYGDAAFDDYPVIFVNWFDARDFCFWREARLPTEAEWERAAGFDAEQGIRFIYPWGDEFDGTALNFCDSNCPAADRNPDYDDGFGDTAPIGTYSAGGSPIDIYDMAGNVMEWVSDWYDSDYYQYSTETNPQGPLEGESKAHRGGSWLSQDDQVRVTGRSSYDPTVSRANLGFRCAMTVP